MKLVEIMAELIFFFLKYVYHNLLSNLGKEKGLKENRQPVLLVSFLICYSDFKFWGK